MYSITKKKRVEPLHQPLSATEAEGSPPARGAARAPAESPASAAGARCAAGRTPGRSSAPGDPPGPVTLVRQHKIYRYMRYYIMVYHIMVHHLMVRYIYWCVIQWCYTSTIRPIPTMKVKDPINCLGYVVNCAWKSAKNRVN